MGRCQLCEQPGKNIPDTGDHKGKHLGLRRRLACFRNLREARSLDLRWALYCKGKSLDCIRSAIGRNEGIQQNNVISDLHLKKITLAALRRKVC